MFTTKMKSYLGFGILIMLVITLNAVWHLIQANNESKKLALFLKEEILVEEIYKTIGHGGFIHHFKNYIIRGEEQYFELATKDYRSFKEKVQEVKNLAIAENKKNEILELEKKLEEYNKNLVFAHELKKSGAPLGEIFIQMKQKDFDTFKKGLNNEKVEDGRREEILKHYLGAEDNEIYVLGFWIGLLVLMIVFYFTVGVRSIGQISRKTKNYFKSILESIETPIFVFTKDLRLRFMNEEAKLFIKKYEQEGDENKDWYEKVIRSADQLNNFKKAVESEKDFSILITEVKDLQGHDDELYYNAKLSFPKTKDLSISGVGLLILNEETNLMEGITIKEVHHRIKNAFSLLFSMSEMLKLKYYGNATAIEVLNTIISKFYSISALYANEQTVGNKSSQKIMRYLTQISNQIQSLSLNSMKINIDIDPSLNLSQKKVVPLGLIFSEFVMNSIKHADAGAILVIDCKVSVSEDSFELFLKDNGKTNFLQNKEEESILSSTGLGDRIISTLAKQIDLTIEKKFDNGYIMHLKPLTL